MGFLTRDLKRFKLYKPTGTKNADGGVYNEYNEPPAFAFDGHIQPFSQREDPAGYGIDPRYAYIVFAAFDKRFEEMDRIAIDGAMYEIKLIQRWDSYYRLLAEDVSRDG